MTEFTTKDKPTYGDILHPAMAITDKGDAKQYLEKYIDWLCARGGYGRKQGHQTALRNIGYFAGYYDDATAIRVMEMFGAVHPFFGSPPYQPKYLEENTIRIIR